MDQEPLVRTILHRPDPSNNNQTFTLVVPAGFNIEDAKETLLNTVWGKDSLLEERNANGPR
mgnify:CR=1 FL=1